MAQRWPLSAEIRAPRSSWPGAGPSRAPRRTVRLALFATLTACSPQQDDEHEGPRCDWVVEDVALDQSLGPWGGDPNYDLQPGKILDLLTVPLRGTLTWNGAGDWADMTPSEGTTEFTSMLSYRGRTTFREVPGADGDLALVCPDMLDFEVSITMLTNDGVLDERWPAVVSFDLFSSGLVSTELDPDALGVLQQIDLTPNPDPPRPYDDPSYWMPLTYRVNPLSSDLPTTMSGRLHFRGQFETEMDGEIIEMSGFNRRLLEWAGVAEQ